MARAARHGDPANKRLFSHRRMAADLIRLLGDDWIDRLNLDRLERLPAEHVTESLRRRLADMPWWAPLRAGSGPPGAGALFHIEFQSRPDPQMAERMLEYAVLLRRDLRRSGWMSAVRARAVAHVPLVAYSGRAAWNAPPDIERHGGWMPRELALRQPRYELRVVDAKDYAGDDATDGNLARALMAVDAVPAGGLAAALRRAAELLAATGDEELARSFEAWCDGVLRPRLKRRLPGLANMMEAPTMLEETLREWEERKLDEGRQEGRREGRQEGRREGLAAERALLCSQAGRRFGAATGTALAGVLAGVEDSDELARVGALIIDCGSGSDLLAQARPR